MCVYLYEPLDMQITYCAMGNPNKKSQVSCVEKKLFKLYVWLELCGFKWYDLTLKKNMQ